MNNKMFNSKRLISRTKAGLLSSLMIFNAGNMCVNSKVLENKNFKTQDRNYIINKYDKKVAKIAVPVTVATLLLGFCAWYFSGSSSTEENREGPQEIDPLINPKTTNPVVAEPHTGKPIVKPIVEEEEDNQKYRECKQALDDWKLDRAEYLETATNFDEDSKPMLYVLATCLDLFFCWNAYYDEENDDVWGNYKKIDFEFAKNAFAGAVININEDYADQVLNFISKLCVEFNDFSETIDKFFSLIKLRLKYCDIESKAKDYEISYNNLFDLVIPKRLSLEHQKNILCYVANIARDKYEIIYAQKNYNTNTIHTDNIKKRAINGLIDLGYCSENEFDFDNLDNNRNKELFEKLNNSYSSDDIFNYLKTIYSWKDAVELFDIDFNMENEPKFVKSLIKSELNKINVNIEEIDNRLIDIVLKEFFNTSYEDGYHFLDQKLKKQFKKIKE